MLFIVRAFFVFIVCFSMSYAEGRGNGSAPPPYWDSILCFGYADGRIDCKDGCRFYEEGQIRQNVPFCSGVGCYANCMKYSDVVNLELITRTENYYLRINPDAEHILAKNKSHMYACKTNSCGYANTKKDSPFATFAFIECSDCLRFSMRTRPEDTITTLKPIGSIIIEELNKINSLDAPIYTKVAGDRLNLKISRMDNKGKIDSDLDSVNCEVSRDGRIVTRGSARKQNNMFVYTTSQALSASGHYSITCEGMRTQYGVKQKSTGSHTFYVAPASYLVQFKLSVNGKEYATSPVKAESNGATYTSVINKTNDSYPIFKVGQELSITLNGTVNNRDLSIDSGVNTSLEQKGSMQATIDGYNTKAGRAACKATPPVFPTDTKVRIDNGRFTNVKAGALTFNDVYTGNISVSYIDREVNDKISYQEVRKACYGKGIGHGKCPYPPEFKFTFPFLVVPNNFSVALKDALDRDIKVLYYGQGSSPENEKDVKLQVTPLSNSNRALKNFVYGCAAIDTTLELNGLHTSVSLIDRNDSTSSSITNIKASDFRTQTDGTAMADLRKILVVKNSNGGEWLPSMVAEPTFFDGDVTPLMYFTGKKDNIAYPQYQPIFNSLSNAVILRGRINIIDSDNAGNYGAAPSSKVYYEFYCKTCNLSDISRVTGVKSYVGSPTSQGWWIDSSFGSFNATSIKTSNVTTTPNSLSVSGVSNINNGLQTISYNRANRGRYEVKINQGGNENYFPLFLLYSPYYDASVTNGTSAFVTIYDSINNEQRDFGVDTGVGKNTRSGSRTGSF